MAEIQKIAIVGPESTGKSSLAAQLAEALGTAWVPEYARKYLQQIDRPYLQEDLTEIARGQLALEEAWLPKAKDFLICDTNLLVIKIWSEFKYGNLLPELENLIDLGAYKLHFLTYIDLPWTFDPLRENPSLEDREELFSLYKTNLEEAGVDHQVLKGGEDERLTEALSACRALVGDERDE